jgi:hypothetical protein
MRAGTILVSVGWVIVGTGAFACGSEAPSESPSRVGERTVAAAAGFEVTCAAAEGCGPSERVRSLTGARTYDVRTSSDKSSITIAALGDGGSPVFTLSYGKTGSASVVSYVNGAKGESLVSRLGDSAPDPPEYIPGPSPEGFNDRYSAVIEDLGPLAERASRAGALNPEISSGCVILAIGCAGAVVTAIAQCAAECAAGLLETNNLEGCYECGGNALTAIATCAGFAAECCTPMSQTQACNGAGTAYSVCGGATMWNGCFARIACTQPCVPGTVCNTSYNYYECVPYAPGGGDDDDDDDDDGHGIWDYAKPVKGLKTTPHQPLVEDIARSNVSTTAGQ